MRKRLKELRKTLKLTQTEFGRDLNLSFGHISDMEAGRKTITDRTISDICSRYHVSESWLRTGEGDMFVRKDHDTDEEATKRYLLHLFAALPEEMQVSAIDFMRDLLAKAETKFNVGKKKTDDLAGPADAAGEVRRRKSA